MEITTEFLNDLNTAWGHLGSIEQVLKLKDGRVIFKTHNGFKSWLLVKGKVTEVTGEYYRKVKHNTKLVGKNISVKKPKVRKYGAAKY